MEQVKALKIVIQSDKDKAVTDVKAEMDELVQKNMQLTTDYCKSENEMVIVNKKYEVSQRKLEVILKLNYRFRPCRTMIWRLNYSNLRRNRWMNE
jgi:hypothetical protein